MRHSYCVWLPFESHNHCSFTLILIDSPPRASLHLFLSLLRSRSCVWCCPRPILQTASQGHSQSKCMLMPCLEELPRVPSILSPCRCGTRLSQGGGSRCKDKGGAAAGAWKAVMPTLQLTRICRHHQMWWRCGMKEVYFDWAMRSWCEQQ